MSVDQRISALRKSIPLKDVVAASVRLESEPSGLRGSCPFHPDASRGLYVSGWHFHCFSCGRGGDVIDWTRFSLGIGRSEALARLAEGSARSMPGQLPPPPPLPE